MSTEEVLNPGVEEKISVAKQKKEVADQAFKSGDFTAGTRYYYYKPL